MRLRNDSIPNYLKGSSKNLIFTQSSLCHDYSCAKITNPENCMFSVNTKQ